MWQSKTVWTKTFIVFYRDIPTSDGRLLVTRDVEVSRERLPAPVLLRMPSRSLHDSVKPIGKIVFLNESDDGAFWADVELEYHPETLPPKLYPQVDFGRPDVGGTVTLIGMHLGFKPAWRSLDPVT